MQKITDIYLRNLKGTEKIRDILVDQRLYLRVKLLKNGRTVKKWYLRYYDAAGKQQRYTMGDYPEIGLADARRKALELRDQFKEGGTLAEQARQGALDGTEKTGPTFREIADEWFGKQKSGWVEGHALRQRERLEAIYRVFGDRLIDDVTMDDIGAFIGTKTQVGHLDVAKRALSLIRQVLEYAETMGRLEDSRILIRIGALRKSIQKPRRERHLYRPLTEAEIAKLLADIEIVSTRLKVETACAIRIAPYVMVRPKELCGARWDEIDLGKAEWVIPAGRMKMEREHIVPLPSQVVRLLAELKPITGNHEFVFPSYSKTKPHIGTEALIRVFRRMGYVSYLQNEGTFFTTHGFRGMASTLLYQKLKFPGHLIELQLAHVDENKVRAAYNQINSRSWLDERRKMLQAYADFLDGLKNSELENRTRETE